VKQAAAKTAAADPLKCGTRTNRCPRGAEPRPAAAGHAGTTAPPGSGRPGGRRTPMPDESTTSLAMPRNSRKRCNRKPSRPASQPLCTGAPSASPKSFLTVAISPPAPARRGRRRSAAVGGPFMPPGFSKYLAPLLLHRTNLLRSAPRGVAPWPARRRKWTPGAGVAAGSGRPFPKGRIGVKSRHRAGRHLSLAWPGAAGIVTRRRQRGSRGTGLTKPWSPAIPLQPVRSLRTVGGPGVAPEPCSLSGGRIRALVSAGQAAGISSRAQPCHS